MRSYAKSALLIFISVLPAQMSGGDYNTSEIKDPVFQEQRVSEIQFIPYKSLVSAHKDKIKHFSVSLFLVTTAGYYLCNYSSVSKQKSLKISTAFSLGIGVGKEIADSFQADHDASWGDFIADALGILAGGVILHNMP